MRSPTTHGLVGASSGALAALLLLAWMPGCSVIQDFGECAEDAECRARYGPQATCAEDGICQRLTREQMLSRDCLYTYGDITQEGTHVVGVLLPLSGALSGLALPSWLGMELAVDDVNRQGGVNGQPMTLLVCDTGGQREQAQRVATHLVDVAGVQAILGPMMTTNAFSLGPGVAKARSVPMISPAATSATISTLDDGGYMWRTVASDERQGEALARLANHVIEEELSEEVDATQAHVARVIHGEDLYAEALSSQFNEALGDVFKGGAEDSRLLDPVLYTGGPDQGARELERAVSADPQAAPRVVILFGLPEVWDIIIAYDEYAREELGREDTIYLVPGQAKDLQRAETVEARFIGRVWGTALAGSADASYTPYQNFRLRYQNKYFADPDRLQFVSNAFDAVYALAIAAHGRPFMGPEIADGLGRISGGEAVNATPSDLQRAYNLVGAGDTITLNGASGPFVFDSGTGDIDAVRDIALWCFALGGFEDRGVIFDGEAFTPKICKMSAGD